MAASSGGAGGAGGSRPVVKLYATYRAQTPFAQCKLLVRRTLRSILLDVLPPPLPSPPLPSTVHLSFFTRTSWRALV
jgi:hypothetical protein